MKEAWNWLETSLKAATAQPDITEKNKMKQTRAPLSFALKHSGAKHVAGIASLALTALLSFGIVGAAAAATPEAKAAYQQAKDEATATYKAARAKCDVITGNPKDVCVAEAKAARVRTEEEADAHYKNTLRAYTQARLKIASANFDLDKVKCASLTGNDKDVCVQQAKATLVAAQADAKADKKAIEARTDARDDKRTAEYKVALEKCDAFAGAAKDSCVSAAKTQYGK